MLLNLFTIDESPVAGIAVVNLEHAFAVHQKPGVTARNGFDIDLCIIP